MGMTDGVRRPGSDFPFLLTGGLLSKCHNLSKFQLNVIHKMKGKKAEFQLKVWHVSESVFSYPVSCNNQTAYFVVFEHWRREQCSVVMKDGMKAQNPVTAAELCGMCKD